LEASADIDREAFCGFRVSCSRPDRVWTLRAGLAKSEKRRAKSKSA
jgi:hypothetical protein